MKDVKDPKTHEWTGPSTYYEQKNNVHSVPSITDVLRLCCNADNYLKPAQNVSVPVVRAVEDLLVSHLFHLNAETERMVEKFVYFSGLQGKQYLAVHIRATDKAKELNAFAWDVIHDMDVLYSCISEFLNAPVKLNHAFLSSDDCSIIFDLSRKV